MAKAGPGKSFREGITLVEIFRMFPDDDTAERWFAEARWPDGPWCPHCGSANVQSGAKHKSQPYRCRDCRKRFSVKTGTAMHDSKLGLQVWAIATYLMTTGIKGTSSMKLHRDLGVTQKTAWHLAHRLRETWQDESGDAGFAGPVEVDETYVGGKKKNMSKQKRRQVSGRGPAGKTMVIGAKDRQTNSVAARVLDRKDGETLQGFVKQHAAPGAKVYTDTAGGYHGMTGFDHETVNHNVSEYVRGQAHTNGMESFWAALKRGYHGTFHHISPKHIDRYVGKFAGRHNVRPMDTLDQMRAIVRGLVGKRLQYRALIR